MPTRGRLQDGAGPARPTARAHLFGLACGQGRAAAPDRRWERGGFLRSAVDSTRLKLSERHNAQHNSRPALWAQKTAPSPQW